MRQKPNRMAAAVLAGGKSSRMLGMDKAFMRVNGANVIQRTINILKEIFAQVTVVTNPAQDLKIYSKQARIITDIIKDIGPLGGIHSALSIALSEAVFFVPCDMPFLHNDLILSQIEYFKTKDCDALVPRLGNSIEPLHAIYKKDLADDIRRFVKDGGNYSIREFLKTIDVCYWDLEDTPIQRNIFRNVNTRQDLKQAGGNL